MNPTELGTDVLVNLFKVLSKPDALEIFLLAGEGIENSTYAIEELGFTSKRYYARLRELVDMGFVKKTGGVYRQTPFGSMIYSRLFPAMGRAYESRDRLGLISEFKGTEIEDDVRELLEEELNLPDFAVSTKLRLIDNYEAMVVDVIDFCDEAEKSILMASNYLDVRVMETVLRAMERDVISSFIVGKRSLPSKMQGLRMILSLSFTKTVINSYSKKVDVKDIVRIAEIPYSFCIVDGHRMIIDIPNTIDERFIVALSINDRVICEMFTDYYNALWEAGEYKSAIEALNSLRSN